MMPWLLISAIVSILTFFALKFVLLLRKKQMSNRENMPFPFPTSIDQLDRHFLTWALRRKGALDFETRVASFETRRLEGGVHYCVDQVLLKYETLDGISVEPSDRRRHRPASIVAKLLNGKISFSVRVMQAIHAWSPTLSRLLFSKLQSVAVRVKSYKIETRLYRKFTSTLDIPTPYLYFCHDDVFNVQFLMLLEDLTSMDRGEPNGFNKGQCQSLVKALARFHASSLNNPQLIELSKREKFWYFGGYWLGKKEMRHDMSAKIAAKTFVDNCRSLFSGKQEAVAMTLGNLLDKVVVQLTFEVHALKPRALLHGDFKLSNVFVGKQPKERVFAIDWQWFGGGCPAADLAYFVYTSIHSKEWSDEPEANSCQCKASVESLDRGKDNSNHGGRSTAGTSANPYHYYGHFELELMRCYHTALQSRTWSFDEFERAYRLNVVYFALFCLRCKFAFLSVEKMEEFASTARDGLHLRLASHMHRLLARALVLLRHSPSLVPALDRRRQTALQAIDDAVQSLKHPQHPTPNNTKTTA